MKNGKERKRKRRPQAKVATAVYKRMCVFACQGSSFKIAVCLQQQQLRERAANRRQMKNKHQKEEGEGERKIEIEMCVALTISAADVAAGKN